MVRIKLCGITRLEDALRAVDLGIDVLGFNFVGASPRRIEARQAEEIAARLPAFVLRVGVFANEPHASLCDKARMARIHCVQFHGEEQPDECANSPLPWYKAHRPAPGFDLQELQLYDPVTSLLDTYQEDRRGGTGMAGNWDLARQASAGRRIILAGGLTPDNISMAIQTVRPYAVDVNSGVESSPGRKDHDRLARFVARVGATGDDAGRPR